MVEGLITAGVFVHSQSTLYPEHNGNPDQSVRTVPLPAAAAAAVTQLGFEPPLLPATAWHWPSAKAYKYLERNRIRLGRGRLNQLCAIFQVYRRRRVTWVYCGLFQLLYLSSAIFFCTYVQVKKKKINNNVLHARFEKKKSKSFLKAF